MLNEKDWQIAKKLISIVNQDDESKTSKTIILLSELLSTQYWYAYSLIPSRNNASGITYLRGVKVISGRTEEEIYTRPTEISSRKLTMQLQNGGGNAFPKLVMESEQNGSACKVRLSGDTVYAFAVVQHDAPPAQPPLQLLLKLLPTSKPSHQKAQLLETLLPPIATSLHSHFFPYQPEGSLTRREHQILKMIAGGSKAAQVANKLSITERTVNFHLGRTYRKLNAHNRHEALCAAQKAGLIGSGGTATRGGIRLLHEKELNDIGGGFGQLPQSILAATPLAAA